MVGGFEFVLLRSSTPSAFVYRVDLLAWFVVHDQLYSDLIDSDKNLLVPDVELSMFAKDDCYLIFFLVHFLDEFVLKFVQINNNQ